MLKLIFIVLVLLLSGCYVYRPYSYDPCLDRGMYRHPYYESFDIANGRVPCGYYGGW